MFIYQEGNYYEYVLHHALSNFLIIFSYLSNQWFIGIMVLFCHDISDFFLIFARAYRVFLKLFLGLQELLKNRTENILCFRNDQLDRRKANIIPTLLRISEHYRPYNHNEWEIEIDSGLI